MKRSTVTIGDVAARSSVSKATVSLVMNGRPGFKAETVERVLEAARDLGFTPNGSARRLGAAGASGSRTMMVGFLTDHPVGASAPDPFHFNVMLGVQQAADAHSYHVLVSMNKQGPQAQLDYIRGLTNDGVDGWVLADVVSSEVVNFLQERDIPKVIAGDAAFFPDVTSVHGDSVGGAGMATQHLIGLGHQNIAFVSWNLQRAWSGMRWAGYLGALGRAGLERHERLLLFANSMDECKSWFEGLLRDDLLPTAIVGATDWMALEIMKIAAANGLSIPDDLSVVGFDDAPWFAPVAQPPLTSVHVPMQQIGEATFQCLHDEIQRITTPGRRIALPVELIVRSSTAAPCKNRKKLPDLSLENPASGYI